MKLLNLTAAILLVLLLFIAGSTEATTITGSVADSSNGKLIRGVTVKASTQGTKPVITMTDEKGRYTLTSIPAGLYTLRFSHVGFVTAVRDSINTGSSDTLHINIKLVPTVVDVNAISISASRRPEKIVAAPASVTVVDSATVQASTTLSTADHLKSLPSVDAVATGINSSSVVVRGFNNVFSTTLLSMIDNRLTQVPSLRVNAYQFVPIVNDDIERIELVLGPGSALYGPNCTDGVMHIITKSPLASQGLTVSGFAGERDLRMMSIRYAGLIRNNLGFRISGQQYKANDWEVYDPAEPDTVTLFRQTPDGNNYDFYPIDNSRNFEVYKFSLDSRIDWAAGDETMLIANGGVNESDNIELTDLGAAQAKGWRLGYAQMRLTHKDLFAQAYANLSFAGDTYLRRSGARISDNSRFYSGQIQHAFRLGERQSFTYGFDTYFTRPSTGGTLHGRNEQNDNISEYGVYLQSESKLAPWLKLVAAGRVDDHSLVDDLIFSPRVGLTLTPTPSHNFRATFNRAYANPAAPNFFLDILSGSVPNPDPALEPIIGPTIMNVRGLGAGEGFTFSYYDDGRPEMVSLYGSLLEEMGYVSAPNDYLSPDVNSVWPAMRQMAVASDPALDAILPASLSEQLPGQYAVLDPYSESHSPVDPSSVSNIDVLRERRTTTYEIGYTGLIAGRLAVGADVYYTRMHNFIGPMMVETPHVFIDSSSFVETLTRDIMTETGGAVDSLTADAVATSMYNDFEELPIGLVSPQEIQNPTDVVMTYRNFGELDITGADLSLCYHMNEHFNISGTYSYLSKNLFRKLDNVTDLSVNAPLHKFSGCFQYLNSRLGLNSRFHVRFVDGFPVNSGVYIGEVQQYTVFDLNLIYDWNRTRFAITVRNLFDNRHAEFVGAPEMGRLAILRISQSLF